MTNRPISEMHLPGPISFSFLSSVLSVSSLASFLSAALPGPSLAHPPQLQRKRATYFTHSGAIGNCCPTSCTRSNIYHYITYPLSARRHFPSGPPQKGGSYRTDTNPRTCLKAGHYKRKEGIRRSGGSARRGCAASAEER